MPEIELHDGWKMIDLDPRDILLDTENPRIDAIINEEQEALRRKLLKTSRVIDLAKDIIDFGGLIQGERIIIASENGKYVVLEGNRRVAASQMLLDRSLIPDEFKPKFPVLDDPTALQRIECIYADLAPNREAAELVITLRHTSIGPLRWSPAANHRRIQRLFKRGRSFDDIAKQFGITKPQLRKFLRESELLQRAYDLTCWTQSEQEQLADPELRTNPYTRFFTLRGVKESLGLIFNDDGTIETTLGSKKFAKTIEYIARQLLLPEPGKTKPPANTRTTPQNLFSTIASEHSYLKDLPKKYKQVVKDDTSSQQSSTPNPTLTQSTPSSSGTITAATELTTPIGNGATPGKPAIRHRSAKFFETLSCPSEITDPELRRLADETQRISRHINTFPTAAAFLARALLEKTLRWSITQCGLDTDMKSQCKDADPGLSKLIEYCKQRNDKLFQRNMRKVLDSWINHHKDYCDLIIHSKHFEPSISMLDQLAKETCPFIQKVLNGELLQNDN